MTEFNDVTVFATFMDDKTGSVVTIQLHTDIRFGLIHYDPNYPRTIDLKSGILEIDGHWISFLHGDKELGTRFKWSLETLEDQ